MAKHILLIASIFLVFSGCTPKVTKPAPIEKVVVIPPVPITSQQTAYRLGIGDEVELKFFFTPELNDRLTVRPDGKISMMFAQDIDAAGHTTDELADIIRAKLVGHVTQLDMAVIVRTFASQRIYVGGEVSKPGALQLNGREYLLQALTEAGWVTPQASHDIILLVRRDDKGQEGIYPLDLHKIMSGEDMKQNVPLVAGDLVLAPPSDVVSVDRWVDQNIRQMIPVNTGFFLNNR